MSNKMNFAIVRLYRCLIKNAGLSVFLAFLIPGQLYAECGDTGNAATTESSNEIVTTSNDSQAKLSTDATTVSDTHYKTPITDYENGGYFGNQ